MPREHALNLVLWRFDSPTTSSASSTSRVPRPLTLATSRRLAELLHADLLDDNHSVFTRQRSLQIKEELREYERSSTATVSAYVSPVMDRYLESLATAIPAIQPSVWQLPWQCVRYVPGHPVRRIIRRW